MSAQSTGKMVLLDLNITTALSTTVGSKQLDIGRNVIALAIQCNFTYVASAATSAKAYVQTSFDGGTTWTAIACCAHNTASANRVVNLSGATPVTTMYTLTDATLADSTVKDGCIGNLLRVKYVTVGTYGAGTSMKIYVTPKHNSALL